MRLRRIQQKIEQAEAAARDHDRSYRSLGHEQDDDGAWFRPIDWLAGDRKVELMRAARTAHESDQQADREAFAQLYTSFVEEGRTEFQAWKRRRTGSSSNRGAAPEPPDSDQPNC